MDVTTGRLAADKGTGGDPAMEWFYLGGLDKWRIAFNQDWDRAFQPPKKHFRSDNIDSQRGEAEWDGGNLYFHQTGYDFEWQILPEKQGRTQRQTRTEDSRVGKECVRTCRSSWTMIS